MSGPHSETEGPSTRPISVAELLAKNGTIGAPAVTRRRRRRRGDSDTVTVAELTGDIPVIRDDHEQPGREADGNPAAAAPESPSAREGELATGDQHDKAYWSEPEPRWPKSPPQPAPVSGPERSAYPRPVRQADEPDTGQQSGAEEMSPDPVGEYAGMPVDVMDTEVRDAELDDEDSAFVRSYLHDSTLFGGQTLADELARQRRGTGAGESGADRDLGRADVAAEERPNEAGVPGRLEALWRGSVVVVQSILAVAFGAALFIAFDQLWRWNSIVALVLSVLVILGLVAGVRVVRKTEDIASTLIAVVVGALITLGPLALSLQSS
ncbi:hypothetical protein ACOJVU_19115 [Mycobacterium sp. THU-M104]|uniref:hypothetical protein n=1 Tax=Mycobacterium sp. THU-M104 TaxID=3410515 RepID=UPI003B9A08BA